VAQNLACLSVEFMERKVFWSSNFGGGSWWRHGSPSRQEPDGKIPLLVAGSFAGGWDLVA
jgi:hypothetical protein